MAQIRIKKREHFITMSNRAFQDSNLSNKARGLLATMMSLPPKWNYSVKGLTAICEKDGVDAIRVQLKELETAGYLIRSRTRDSSGKLREMVFTVFDVPWWELPDKELSEIQIKPIGEKPTQEKPILENPALDNPVLENPTQYNKQQLNKQQSIKNESNILSINLDRSDRTEIERTIKNNIDFDILCSYEDRQRLQEIVEMMVDIICSSKETIRINNDDIPHKVVADRFSSINSEHILYALDCLDNRSGDIRNVRAYILTTLYNAPLTIQNYNTTLFERSKRNSE